MCHVTQCSRKRNQQNFLFWKPQAREKAFPHRNSRSPCAECPPRTTASCGRFCAAPSRELLFRFSRSFLFASVTLCKNCRAPLSCGRVCGGQGNLCRQTCIVLTAICGALSPTQARPAVSTHNQRAPPRLLCLSLSDPLAWRSRPVVVVRADGV